MSLKDFAKAIAIGVVADVGNKLSIIGNENKQQEHFTELINKKCSKNPTNIHLLMSISTEDKTNFFTINNKYKQTFYFYNMNGQVIFTAIGKYNNKLQNISLYNATGQFIGSISEKRFSFASSFDISYMGKNVGIIKVKGTSLKWWIESEFNGWKINHGFFKTVTNIVDSNNKPLAEIIPSEFGIFIDVGNQYNLPLILIFILTAYAQEESAIRIAKKHHNEALE